MPRLDASNDADRWRYACPTRQEHRDWRVVDGLFECLQCGETFRELRDLKTGERVSRDEFEIVGPLADSKGRFGTPRTESD